MQQQQEEKGMNTRKKDYDYGSSTTFLLYLVLVIRFIMWQYVHWSWHHIKFLSIMKSHTITKADKTALGDISNCVHGYRWLLGKQNMW